MSTASKTILPAVGLVALLISLLSGVDLFAVKPNDGLNWKLGGEIPRVDEVVPGGPGDRAGVRVGDVILGINHTLVNSPIEAARILAGRDVGDEVEYLIQRGDDILRADLRLESYRIGGPLDLFYLILGLMYAAVGVYVYIRRPDYLPAKIFYLLNISFMVFLSCSFRNSSYYWVDIVIANADALALFLMPAFFLHFFLIFPRRKEVLNRIEFLPVLIYGIPPLFYVYFSFNQVYGYGNPLELWGINIYNWVILSLYLLAGLISLVHSNATTKNPVEKRQIRVLSWGVVLAVIPFVFFGVGSILFFETKELAFLGIFPLMFIPASTAYAIIRHRLFEVEFYIRRSIIYGLLTTAVIVFYIILVEVIGFFLEPVFGEKNRLVMVGAILAVALVFAPLRQRAQRLLERLFYKRDYRLNLSVKELTSPLMESGDIYEIGNNITISIKKNIEPSLIAVLVFEPEGGRVRVISSEGLPPGVNLVSGPVDSESGLIKFIAEREGVVFVRDLEEEYEGDLTCGQLKSNGVELVIPVKYQDKLTGLILLGHKQDYEIYSLLEIELLMSVARQAGVSMQIIYLAEKISETNKQLLQSEHLATLGRLAAGVAHEIRNPLTSIKLNLQSLRRSAQPDTVDNRRLGIILRETDRLEKLVKEMMIFARPVEMKIEQMNLKEVINNSIEDSGMADYPDVDVSVIVDDRTGIINADARRLEQVLTNLIQNSLQSFRGRGGTIEINAGHFGDKAIGDTQRGVLIKVRDTGPGIAEENRDKIFEPFFTTRSEGTGLGLANCKKFVELHGGWIKLNPEIDEGTEVWIYLPQ
ncbi:MAG: PDZ domain-containing protein [candidate division Zixibacteria bacterium]|nr:PDZ domain-containing protein [candidate division Zixibacteria bacterium]